MCSLASGVGGDSYRHSISGSARLNGKPLVWKAVGASIMHTQPKSRDVVQNLQKLSADSAYCVGPPSAQGD